MLRLPKIVGPPKFSFVIFILVSLYPGRFIERRAICSSSSVTTANDKVSSVRVLKLPYCKEEENNGCE